jgi:ATP-dependent Clp protease adaptor protein ClpS
MNGFTVKFQDQIINLNPSLSSGIPGISLDGGYRFADKIHNRGQAAVWTGPREPAELYWEQLQQAGLTMAPLEQH